MNIGMMCKRALSLAPVLFLSACFLTDNDDSGDSGSNTNGNGNGNVDVEVTPDGDTLKTPSSDVVPEPQDIEIAFIDEEGLIIDEANGLILEEYTYTSCMDSGKVETGTDSDTTYFKIMDGKLYMGDSYDCKADVYTGTGTKLEGTEWAYSGRADIPAGAWTPDEWCEDYGDDIPDGVTMTTTWEDGKEKIKGEWAGYCAAEFWLEMMGEGETVPGLEVVDCANLKLSNATDEILINLEKFDIIGESDMVMNFTSNGATCTMTESMRWEDEKWTAATCQAAWDAYQTDEYASEYFHPWDYMSDVEDASGGEDAFESCLMENEFPMDLLMVMFGDDESEEY